MPIISKEQLIEGLQALGVARGAILLVHASLSSLGEVVGGADTVIEALLDVLGPDGTLLMPTHPARDGRTFDPDTYPSDMGSISETFRQRPGVRRSHHPFHPVAACGNHAEEMLRDHEQSAVPDGPETPYGRLITHQGWVLHIGCDLDTLTLLHTVEAELDLPYLRRLEMDYVDEAGATRRLAMARCPGGHRGGVLQFDRLFCQEGAMVVGRIGQAVCRLISAPNAATIMRREMARDPFFSLDDNPHCDDCRRFRGQIKKARLAREDFRLSAPLWAVDGDASRSLALLEGEGIAWVELSAEHLDLSEPSLDELRGQIERRGMAVAILRARLGSPAPRADSLCSVAALLGAQAIHVTAPPVSLMDRSALIDALRSLASAVAGHAVTAVVGNSPGSLVENPGQLRAVIREVGLPSLAASYDPAAMAAIGGSPFYGGLYKGSLRHLVRHVELRDVVRETGEPTPLGRGNAEITEIMSNLRCRSYGGFFCLWPLPGPSVEGFRAAAQAFWRVLDSI
jgi:aminoglycoside 3-N-acetyltransferase